MKFAIRAGLVALSIGSIPPAFAGESGPNPNTSPVVIAEAPPQNAPVAGYAKGGRGPSTTLGHGALP
jgi:hypothetical protein